MRTWYVPGAPSGPVVPPPHRMSLGKFTAFAYRRLQLTQFSPMAVGAGSGPVGPPPRPPPRPPNPPPPAPPPPASAAPALGAFENAWATLPLGSMMSIVSDSGGCFTQ